MISYKNRTIWICIGVVTGLALIVGLSQASPIVYPAKGQSQEQQNRDMGECHQWAVQQTGVDPAQLIEQVNTGVVYQRHHSLLGGAAKGAVTGLLIGAISGNEGRGAAIGATAGALSGGLQERRDLDMQYQVTANAHAEQRAVLEQYDRAYGACLEGRGYTVR